MRYIKYDLPAYPVTTDVWKRLSEEKRPIVVYGMGNGADKLIERFKKYNISIADFFASDGFVRGHMFHGMRVKSFSEIKETYRDFVIVLSFASNREDVLTMLSGINEKYEMYVPDMPVAGDEYFDSDFYNEHYDEITKAFSALSDDASRNAFAAIVNYKLTAKMDYIMDAYSERDELYGEIASEKILSYVDVGAYNGDTVREALEYFPALREVTAIEPDPKNYKRLLKYIDTVTDVRVAAVNSAAWSDTGEGELMSGGNRNSSVNATSSYKHKDTDVTLVSIDSLSLKPDYIKYDVEGAEYEALVGSHKTIKERKPALLVSLYHRSRDIFFLINYLHEKYPFYRISLRRLKCLPAWEIDLLLFNS